MPTQQPRLNLTLDAEIMRALKMIAKKAHISVASVAKEMLVDSLETREDIYFSRLADKRDNEHSRWISHEDFWK